MIIAFGTLMENLLIDVSEDTVICGSDEAGRGPLAGPVVAAAVILPHDFPIGLLGDSIGFEIMPYYLFAFVALMLVMVELMFRAAKRNDKGGISLPQ